MDFDLPGDDDPRRLVVRQWLAEHPSPSGRDLAEAGYVAPHWPRPWGLDADPIEQIIIDEELAVAGVHRPPNQIGIGWAGPTLLAAGNEAQKDRYLFPILSGEEFWCQLFSEPGAGSDLANLGAKAVLDGDEFVVNGQKVWTSGAQHSDWGILLVRTDPDAPKHKGITYLLVDMTSPGIDVRPLRQINGVAHFNEVFLSDVRVPKENMIGELHQGWGPILTTLANERSAIGGGGGIKFDHLAALARTTDRADDPLTRQALAKAYTRYELIRYVGYRVQTALSQGRPPGPESSTLKLAYSQHLAETADLVLAMEGAGGTLDGKDALQGGVWQTYFLGQWASRIGGGTDQIQRNVLGERVLGLPPEPRLDKALPFRDLPKS